MLFFALLLIILCCSISNVLLSLNQFCGVSEDKYTNYLDCRKLGPAQKMEDSIKPCHSAHKPSSIAYGTPNTFRVLQQQCQVLGNFQKCVKAVMNSTKYLELRPLFHNKEMECLKKVFGQNK